MELTYNQIYTLYNAILFMYENNLEIEIEPAIKLIQNIYILNPIIEKINNLKNQENNLDELGKTIETVNLNLINLNEIGHVKVPFSLASALSPIINLGNSK